MNRYLITALLLLLVSFSGSAYIRPEAFGARGDGITDDAPAFNKCIERGETILLSAGKKYLLKSALNAIKGDSFELRGCGASLVIGKNYPMSSKYDHIFRFEDGSRRRNSFILSDLNVEYLPAQKFRDKFALGDTFFVSIDNCLRVELENIAFDAQTHYNNLTFFSTFGVGELIVKSCRIKLNTLSKQGGCIWVMNQYFDNSNITIRDCVFEQDTWDETACFSASALNGPKSSKIIATVQDCVFTSPCISPSSGFIMAYNHYEAPADIRIKFKRCTFLAKGKNSRKIMSYQTGGDANYRYAKINTKFTGCSFDYRFDTPYDTGLLSLPFKTAVSGEDYLFRFRKCSFCMRNIYPVIGDRDGDKSGCYEFRNCSFDSSGTLFAKHYNVPTSEIFVKVNGTKKKLVKPDVF